MAEAFRLGGWGMYPTLVAGLVLLFTAIQYARRPERDRIALVRHLSMLTGLVATLGFVSGVIHCFTSIGAADPDDVQHLVVIGVGESLVNIGLGVGMLVMAWTATAIGTSRAGGIGKPELHDPHAR
jgi:hypothetical protein